MSLRYRNDLVMYEIFMVSDRSMQRIEIVQDDDNRNFYGASENIN